MIVRVPASSANLGPGFDALGMALSLHFELGLVDGSPLPGGAAVADEHHPASVAFATAGGSGAVWVRSHIPAGRGLGFSGAARVAGALGAHVQRLGPGVHLADVAADVLEVAARLERHADNAAASLLGGVVATDGTRAVRVPLSVDPAVVVWVPPDQTSTDASRAKLGGPVEFSDAVFNVGRVALLVAALAAGDVGVLRSATEDRLHQDRRFAGAPASRVALDAAVAAGAWCGWLSGSGPTVAALCGVDHAEEVAATLPEGAAVKILRIDHEGAVVEQH